MEESLAGREAALGRSCEREEERARADVPQLRLPSPEIQGGKGEEEQGQEGFNRRRARYRPRDLFLPPPSLPPFLLFILVDSPRSCPFCTDPSSDISDDSHPDRLHAFVSPFSSVAFTTDSPAKTHPRSQCTRENDLHSRRPPHSSTLLAIAL